MVYVVDELGDTEREPLVLTSPIPWSMDTLVALVVLQDRVEDCPRSMVVGSADNVTVGAAAGAGGGGGGGAVAIGAFFLQPAIVNSNNKPRVSEATLRSFLWIIILLRFALLESI
jgi:hypothetical protein